MFPTRYFANRYWAPRYWPKVGDDSALEETTTSISAFRPANYRIRDRRFTYVSRRFRKEEAQ